MSCRTRWGAPAPHWLCVVAGDGAWTPTATAVVAGLLGLLVGLAVVAWRRAPRDGWRDWWDRLR